MTQYRRSDLDRRPAFFRYIYFLVSTGKFQTFRRWRGNGEPNPFVRPDYAPRATSENEIIETFDQQLRTVRSVGSCEFGKPARHPHEWPTPDF